MKSQSIEDQKLSKERDKRNKETSENFKKEFDVAEKELQRLWFDYFGLFSANATNEAKAEAIIGIRQAILELESKINHHKNFLNLQTNKKSTSQKNSDTDPSASKEKEDNERIESETASETSPEIKSANKNLLLHKSILETKDLEQIARFLQEMLQAVYQDGIVDFSEKANQPELEDFFSPDLHSPSSDEAQYKNLDGYGLAKFLEKLRAEIIELKAKIDFLEKELLNRSDQNTDLQHSNNNIASELIDVKNKLSKQQPELERLKKELLEKQAEFEKEKEKYKEELSKTTIELSSIKRNPEELLDKFLEQENGMTQDHAKELSRINSLLELARKVNFDLNSKLTSIKAGVLFLQEKNNTLIKSLEDEKKRSEVAQSELIERWEKKHIDLKGDLISSNLKLKKTSAQLSLELSKSKDLEKELDELRFNVDWLRAREVVLESYAKDALKRKEELVKKGKKNDSETSLTKTLEQGGLGQNSLEENEHERILNLLLKEKNIIIKESRTENSKLEGDNSKLGDNIKELEEKNSELRNDIKKLEEKNSKLEGAIENLVKINKKLEKENNFLGHISLNLTENRLETPQYFEESDSEEQPPSLTEFLNEKLKEVNENSKDFSASENPPIGQKFNDKSWYNDHKLLRAFIKIQKGFAWNVSESENDSKDILTNGDRHVIASFALGAERMKQLKSEGGFKLNFNEEDRRNLAETLNLVKEIKIDETLSEAYFDKNNATKSLTYKQTGKVEVKKEREDLEFSTTNPSSTVLSPSAITLARKKQVAESEEI